MTFRTKAETVFNVKHDESDVMRVFIEKCSQIYRGIPEWVDENTSTINMARAICAETARLTVLGTKITVDGSPRAEWLQKQIDKLYYNIRPWVEYACGYGTVMLKPNGKGVDVVLPTEFMITAHENEDVTGSVFYSKSKSNDGKDFYTRLEYHRFMNDGIYCVTNRCYVGKSENDLAHLIAIEDTPWNGLEEEVYIENLEKPLFAVLKMPSANTIDIESPLSLPLFSDALTELKDLDIAYSRNSDEIFDSGKVILLDTDRLVAGGVKGASTNANVQENIRNEMKLPRYVRNVLGNGEGDIYHEINPTLNTATRIEGINALLSLIGYKCGYSNGYFVFNQKTGMVTATQVESDDRRTLQTIKDVRDQLENALRDLLYALDKFADLYDITPAGEYEVNFDFGDLTYNREEDRAKWMQYVQMGMVPKWTLLVKFEGYSEEEAKKMVAETEEAAAATNALFSGS